MAAKELYTHIRSLTTLMNDKEREEFYREAKKEGFQIGDLHRRQTLQS